MPARKLNFENVYRCTYIINALVYIPRKLMVGVKTQARLGMYTRDPDIPVYRIYLFAIWYVKLGDI